MIVDQKRAAEVLRRVHLVVDRAPNDPDLIYLDKVVDLWTLPFVTGPDVIMWGSRTFRQATEAEVTIRAPGSEKRVAIMGGHGRELNSRDVYIECFMYVSPHGMEVEEKENSK